jgi:Tfp pilus assembly protein PilV
MRGPFMPLRRTRRSPRRAERGNTIIESLVAFTILIMGSVSLGALLMTTIAHTANSQRQVVAANLANQEIEYARALDLAALPLGATTHAATNNGVEYTITRTARWVKAGADTSSCDGGGTRSSDLAYLRVDAAVTWPRMAGTAPVLSSTLIWPGPDTATDTGTAWVKVVSADNRPSIGHLVTLDDGTKKYQQVTDSDGCVFFTFIRPGSYNASLSTPGYQDPAGNPTPSYGLTVVAGDAPAQWVATYDPIPGSTP